MSTRLRQAPRWLLLGVALTGLSLLASFPSRLEGQPRGNQGRAICTRNAHHFEREHQKVLASGQIHFGIVTIGEWTTEQTFVVLKRFLETTEDVNLLNQLVALPAP